jgi:putative spermidine/putrescine transport system substrate-binding protein
VEDFQEHEYEFFSKLDEESGEGLSRRKLLKRGLVAGAGLTILSTPASALAMRKRVLATPPLRGRDISMAELIAEAKKEGKINVIALPDDWANYVEIKSTFKKKYGLELADEDPQASSGAEVQAIISLKGQSRAPDVVDVGPGFAVGPANDGLYAKYFNTNFRTVPRAMKDGRGFWTGDYTGVIAFGANLSVANRVPTSWADVLSSDFNAKIALNDDPRKANAAFSGVFSAALANGGSLNDITPGIDYFARLAKAGKFQPINVTPQTVASGQTPVTIDWDYNQLGYRKTYTNFKWAVTIPKTGAYAGYYCQAINATAPHPWAARLWEEFLFSDQGQLLWLKGFTHPARFDDLLKRNVVPKALLDALPPASLYAGAKVASLGQISRAKAIVAAQWGPKVLGA